MTNPSKVIFVDAAYDGVGIAVYDPQQGCRVPGTVPIWVQVKGVCQQLLAGHAPADAQLLRNIWELVGDRPELQTARSRRRKSVQRIVSCCIDSDRF